MSANLTDRTRRIIRADGSIELLRHALPMDEIRRRLCAEMLDTVMLRHLGRPRMVMLVNDAGYETEAVTEITDWGRVDGRRNDPCTDARSAAGESAGHGVVPRKLQTRDDIPDSR